MCVQAASLGLPITNIEPCEVHEFNVVSKRCVREPRGIIRAKDWFDGPDDNWLGFEGRVRTFPRCDPNPPQSVLTHGRTH